jgi:hypothetical protein
MPSGLAGSKSLFHIRHKWQKIYEAPQGMTKTLDFGAGVTGIRVIVFLEQCGECGKYRAYAKDMHGQCYRLDADFVRVYYAKEKK